MAQTRLCSCAMYIDYISTILTGCLGAKREEDGELRFLAYICAFVPLVVSFMGKTTDKYNMCAAF